MWMKWVETYLFVNCRAKLKYKCGKICFLLIRKQNEKFLPIFYTLFVWKKKKKRWIFAAHMLIIYSECSRYFWCWKYSFPESKNLKNFVGTVFFFVCLFSLTFFLFFFFAYQIWKLLLECDQWKYIS